eukprot:290790-Chlamydomonas_euryale.AAC.1
MIPPCRACNRSLSASTTFGATSSRCLHWLPCNVCRQTSALPAAMARPCRIPTTWACWQSWSWMQLPNSCRGGLPGVASLA